MSSASQNSTGQSSAPQTNATGTGTIESTHEQGYYMKLRELCRGPELPKFKGDCTVFTHKTGFENRPSQRGWGAVIIPSTNGSTGAHVIDEPKLKLGGSGINSSLSYRDGTPQRIHCRFMKTATWKDVEPYLESKDDFDRSDVSEVNIELKGFSVVGPTESQESEGA